MKGFTLIEMVVVMAIIGLLLAGLLGPLSVWYSLREHTAQKARSERVEDALYAFAMVSGRLPCPDTNGDGHENANGDPVTCTANVGELPHADLGLTQGDQWRRRYRYAVSPAFVQPAVPGASPSTTALDMTDMGQLTVRDDVGGQAIVQAGTVSGAAAIVVSTGRNGTDNPSANEADNLDTNASYVVTNYGEHFDDVVTIISATLLKARLVSVGWLP